MDFNCNVKVVDEIMGGGKTSAAINYINHSDSGEKFLFITPYLEQVKRIKKSCSGKNFVDPEEDRTKLQNIKQLVSDGENIVSTHALFLSFDNELMHLVKSQNYTLILDEVADIINDYHITDCDFKVLKDNFVDIEDNTGLMVWRESEKNYTGLFNEIKTLCDTKSLGYYGGNVFIWLFPIDTFDAFQDVYILTYMFKYQMQKYYFDYHGLSYQYMYVSGDNVDDYQFVESSEDRHIPTCNYHDLIHILDDKKLNNIGDEKNALSKGWYSRNIDSPSIEQLRRNICNFFRHKTNTKSSANLWTTFKKYKSKLNGKGYGKGFAPLNARASNKYINKTAVAYPVNRYMNPCIKNFFSKYGIKIDDDGYALSEMLQFIWRSAIREGKEIWVYVPSSRMRDLLIQWIDDNSKKIENKKEKYIA